MKRQPDKILEVADVETVAEALDLDTRRMGSRISILCPSHDDTHHGSCFLTERGFHCFACGARGDVISLVRAAKTCSFDEACDFLEGMYGLSANYNKRPTKALLPDHDLQLIGLAPTKDGSGMQVARHVVDAITDYDALPKGCRTAFEPFYIAASEPRSDAPTGVYVISKVIDKNPLRTLMETDEKSYNKLIADKATEAIEMYRGLLEIFERCGQVAVIQIILNNIRRCEDIRAAHSPSTQQAEPTPKRNRFSIKRGDSI